MCAVLEDVELDAEIPVELFEAAAAVLAEVGALSPDKAGEPSPLHALRPSTEKAK